MTLTITIATVRKLLESAYDEDFRFTLGFNAPYDYDHNSDYDATVNQAYIN